MHRVVGNGKLAGLFQTAAPLESGISGLQTILRETRFADRGGCRCPGERPSPPGMSGSAAATPRRRAPPGSGGRRIRGRETTATRRSPRSWRQSTSIESVLEENSSSPRRPAPTSGKQKKERNHRGSAERCCCTATTTNAVANPPQASAMTAVANNRQPGACTVGSRYLSLMPGLLVRFGSRGTVGK